MSYDLAVWEGPRPRTDEDACATFETQHAPAMEAEERPSPTPAIRRYVDALLARYPDLDDDNEDECPWSDAPLLANACGPLLYVSMRPSKADTASEFAAKLAKEHGLVCFDPQSSTLR